MGNLCDVQAAVLCCAVAAEAPKNRKKIWKKKEQSQWSAVSHQTDAAAAEYHPLITDWSQPVCCCVCATSFGFGPITAALNQPSLPQLLQRPCLPLPHPAALPPLPPNIRTMGPATLCARCPSIQVTSLSVSQASAAASFRQRQHSTIPITSAGR